MAKKLIFISKDANWQLYRNEVLTKLAFEYDYDVEILTTGKVKEHLKENSRLKYRLFKNWYKGKGQTSFFPGAISYALKNKPYAVLALNNSTQLTEYLMSIICKVLGIQFVWWTHAYDHNPKRTGLAKKIKNAYVMRFLRVSKAIMTFSVTGKDFLVSKGFKAEKIFPALNTLDTDKLTLLKEKVGKDFDKAAFLSSIFKDYTKTDNSITLLFSGRLKIDKKVPNAVSAIKQLNDEGTNARLFIVGDGEDMPNLKALVKELGVEDKVHFSGYVFDEDLISKFFLAADLFIMPGYVGLAIIHSFTFGLPIITENIDFHSPEIQYLQNGENGYLIEENNIAQMVSVIQNIKNNPEVLAKLKAGVKHTIDTDANINSMISNINKALSYQNNSKNT